MENETRNRDELRTALANYAHEAWSGWMRYLFTKGSWGGEGAFTIDPDMCARWTRQIDTPFFDLPEDEKQSDYDEVDKILALVNQYQPDDEEIGKRVLDGELSENRVFLEHLADELESPEITADVGSPAIVRRLRAIAIGCDQLALEKLRLKKLEDRVDQFLCEHIEYMMGDRSERNVTVASYDMLHVAATWLLGRRIKSSGTMNVLGSGLGVLGASLIGSAFRFKDGGTKEEEE